MPLRNPSRWWRQTRLVTWLAAAAIVAISIGGVGYAARPASGTLMSIPIGLLLGAIALPFALAVLVHWLALRQDRLDRDYSVWEGR